MDRVRNLEENFEIVYADDADVMDGSFLAVVQELDSSDAGVKIVSERYDIFSRHDLTVFFDIGQRNRLAGIKHFAGGGDVD